MVVQFFDDSEGEVDSWSWTFPGGNPGTSSEQNPTTVTYDTPGTYDVTLVVTNSAGSDTITNENYITVSEPIFAGFNFIVNGFDVTFYQ